MPMLALTCRLMPPRWNGSSRARAIWAATARPPRVGVVGEQHGELVAAEPGDRVGGRERALQPPAHLDEQAVAVVVAESVVDLLELVEVHDDERHRFGRARRALQRLAQPVVEQRAVGQTGQPVVQRLAAQDLGGDDPVGDVLQRHADVAVRAAGTRWPRRSGWSGRSG